jgi:hypothetical protein
MCCVVRNTYLGSLNRGNDNPKKFVLIPPLTKELLDIFAV